jgi:hypothetical protein
MSVNRDKVVWMWYHDEEERGRGGEEGEGKRVKVFAATAPPQMSTRFGISTRSQNHHNTT